MINIIGAKIDIQQIPTNCGLVTLPGKHHYFDENGNEIFPQYGEKYNYMGEEKTYPF